MKRNCRQWKERQRFLDSWKDNNLAILILCHPQHSSKHTFSGPLITIPPNFNDHPYLKHVLRSLKAGDQASKRGARGREPAKEL